MRARVLFLAPALGVILLGGAASFSACGARSELPVRTDAGTAAVDSHGMALVDAGSEPPPKGHLNGIALGDAHTCARRTDGTVACWGKDLNGQLGNGVMALTVPMPVDVVGVTDAVEITAGQIHTCARRATGAVLCWGDNTYGQLGNGSTTASAIPVAVAGIADAVELTSGAYHVCARMAAGAVLCWGHNQDGQLGIGSTTDAPIPNAVVGLTDAVALGAGDAHTCAVRQDRTAMCWGRNTSGQLGDTSLQMQITPVAVVDLSGADELTAGELHTCARTGGTIQCWGVNGNGQLGYGLFEGGLVNSLTPVEVTGISDAAGIGAGDERSCARLGGGTAMCWGANNQGQLGDGKTDMALAPVPVINLSDVAELAVGSDHTCARTMGNTLSCWGANDFGQLGDGSTTLELMPTQVVGL